MDNAQLLQDAKEAIENLYSDTSVSEGKCKSNMMDLADMIQMKLDSLGDVEEED